MRRRGARMAMPVARLGTEKEDAVSREEFLAAGGSDAEFAINSELAAQVSGENIGPELHPAIELFRLEFFMRTYLCSPNWYVEGLEEIYELLLACILPKTTDEKLVTMLLP